MKFDTPAGVNIYSPEESIERYCFINETLTRLFNCGYSLIEVPTIQLGEFYDPVTEGTENRTFSVGDNCTLLPEATKYISAWASRNNFSGKLCYSARCFRDETTTDSTRKREFTQIGVEIIRPDTSEAFFEARSTAIELFKQWLGETGWEATVPDQRGVNLYDGMVFEIETDDGLQLAGGGEYENGAGFALGVERLMTCG